MSVKSDNTVNNQASSNLWQKIGRHSLLLIKKCRMPMAILVIMIAILFSVFRALTPWATQYKGEVERQLSSLIGQPVIITSMETSWYWFEPVLKLNQVTISDHQDQVLKLSKLLVGINLFSSLWHWHIQPGVLYVDDVHLTLRQLNDRWQIDGLRPDRQVMTLEPDAYLPTLSWLLGQEKIIIKNVSALIHLSDGSLLPLSALNITAVNRHGHYRLRGHVKLAQTMSTELLVLADMNVNPYALNRFSGHAYFSVQRFMPTQWQGFLGQTDYRLQGGKGNFEVWLDFAKGQLVNAQTQLNFRRLAWNKKTHPQSQFIQGLRGNLAWNPTSYGWQLSGDKIKLRADGIRWPENSIIVRHHTDQKSYRVFIKTLLLEPLLAEDIPWPDLAQPVLALHPRGELHDTQIDIKEGQADYVLTRFAHLGWSGKDKLPAVSNLSGVLHWQPTKGRLELDGENTIITLKKNPPLNFTELNAAFDWKELSSGLRITMERLILSHPDFVMTAQGALDEPFAPTRNLRLAADFSLDHAEQWLRYIPTHTLKKKLEAWLKQDIKRIDKARGRVTINGPLADFPFDKQPGDFSIVTHLSGVDLIFHKEWPLSQDIDALLRVEKRQLDVDVFQADLLGVLVDKVSLRIDDLGLDHETLLVHGTVEAPANKALAYVFSSPLRTHLAKLKPLELQGTLGLDLRLEVPLYPENDDVLAQGTVTFNDNDAIFHHSLNDMELNHLSGLLEFDEHGVTDSALKGSILGGPVAIRIQSVRKQHPYTEVKIVGNTTVNLLRSKLNLPILSVMNGHLGIESKLTLTDDPKDFDHLLISSPLEGVFIDLPAPFGKSSAQKRPLSIDIGFNPNKALKLKLDYADKLHSDIRLLNEKGSFVLDRGQIQVGARKVFWHKTPGLQVVGSLPSVDIQQWRQTLSKLSSVATSTSGWSAINGVDIKLENLTLWQQHYANVAIHANKLDKDQWSIQIEQQKIAGDIRYQTQSHTLSGSFARLYLPKSDFSKKTKNGLTANLKLNDIPNLNVSIDMFKLGELDVGQVELQSSTMPQHWHLEDCKIKSPEYQIMMKGDWRRQGKMESTQLQANVKINHLAKTLERLKITPVVEANSGEVQYDGGWRGSPTAFSLAKTNGQINMKFKDGRITHLSPETEEKLGLGKLLSVLSLQTIPRRLKLDFSDLSHHGYSYDVFEGSFTLKNGVMNTSDSYIDGPVAHASIKGDLDLAKQLYNVELHISPHITASLPIVATIAGGPIAGIATWVASKIINQGMQRVTGYTYKITGPWQTPIVEQVSILKKSAEQ